MNLCKRLLTVAEFVGNGESVADIGTDHAKLPVYLIKKGVSPYAVASDISEGPLKNAQSAVEQANLSDKIRLNLGAGLKGIDKNEVDTVVIAGMGGEMIANILHEDSWCKEKRLILQPMTAADRLRLFLRDNGFCVVKERAVVDNKKIYSVMEAVYTGEVKALPITYPYIGFVTSDYIDGKAYINHQKQKLIKIKEGLKKGNGDPLKISELEKIIEEIK